MFWPQHTKVPGSDIKTHSQIQILLARHFDQKGALCRFWDDGPFLCALLRAASASIGCGAQEGEDEGVGAIELCGHLEIGKLEKIGVGGKFALDFFTRVLPCSHIVSHNFTEGKLGLYIQPHTNHRAHDPSQGVCHWLGPSVRSAAGERGAGDTKAYIFNPIQTIGRTIQVNV